MKKQAVSVLARMAIASALLSAFVTASGPLYAEVRIWAAGSTEKIQDRSRSSLPHDRVWNAETNTVTLAGVRGEHVPFQVVVTADHVNMFGVTVKASILRAGANVLPAENVRLYFEHLINVYTPSGEHGKKGLWPDALVPLTRPFDITSGGRGWGPVLRHHPVWVDIVVPRHQQAGIYKGAITVSSAEGELGRINVELEVWDLELPAKRHLPLFIGLYGDSSIARVHGVAEDGQEFRELYYKYMEFFFDNQIDPGFLSFGLKGRVEDGSFVLEWTDKRMEKFCLGKGLSWFMISAAPPGIKRESGETPFSDQYTRYVRQYVEQVIDHARKNGWYDRLVFLSPIDEPCTADEYEGSRRWSKVVRTVDPNVHYWICEQPVPENSAWGSLVGHATFWGVHGNYLDSNAKALVERQKAGEVAVWYISCDQLYPQPNFFIDREAADPRMVSWITWRYKLGGFGYWTATFWRDVKDPWVDPVVWKRIRPLSGEGSLLYPGNLAKEYTGQENVFGPIASIRFELLREGLEELALLRKLKEMGGQSAADQIVASICKGIRDFTRDPNAIDAAKEEIVQEILRRQ